MGLTTSVSGNHSIRFENEWMWITPSGIPRDKMHLNHLVKVHLKSGKVLRNNNTDIKPSIEFEMHRSI